MNAVRCDKAKITPSKVICIGRNYVEHINELDNEKPDEPVVFIKPNSAISSELITGEDEPIHYEGEICFLIQSSEISAVGFGLDLTKRQLQSKLKAKGLPWEKAKAFDGAAVFSEFVSFSGALDSLRLELWINDKLIQSGSYQQMIFKPDVFMADIKSFLTIEDGDIVMSGTPKGVGVVDVGDKFVGKIYSGNELLVEATWAALATNKD